MFLPWQVLLLNCGMLLSTAISTTTTVLELDSILISRVLQASHFVRWIDSYHRYLHKHQQNNERSCKRKYLSYMWRDYLFAEKICKRANLGVLGGRGGLDWPVCRTRSDLLNLLNKICTRGRQDTHYALLLVEIFRGWEAGQGGWGVGRGGGGGVTSKMSTWLAFLCLSSYMLPLLCRDDSGLGMRMFITSFLKVINCELS